MDFEGAKQYLDKFISYEKMRDPSVVWNFELGRVERFLDEWCEGWRRLKILHIGGSKGKGTVCTLISDYLSAGCEIVGLFLSPHVVSVCERISVCGADIEEEGFAELVEDFSEFVGKKECDLTWFEVLFVLSLKYFVACGCEYAVLEVGLGGRLDATNVVMPLVTAIVSIELEHVDVLGDTVEKIFEEKWGIKKEGVPMVCSENLRALVGEREAFFAEGNKEVAKLALVKAGIEVDNEVFAEVVENFRMIGRFDVRDVDGKIGVFDIAHTEKSVERLVDRLVKSFPGETFVFLVGLLKDKNSDGILRVLRMAGNVVIVSGFRDRAADGENWKAAYDRSLRELKKDRVLVVTGSSYLVGEVLKLLR